MKRALPISVVCVLLLGCCQAVQGAAPTSRAASPKAASGQGGGIFRWWGARPTSQPAAAKTTPSEATSPVTASRPAMPAQPDRPWIGVVFFYWYTWDYKQQLGGWIGGVHNTPLYGYYDSRTYRDNLRSLRLASEWGVTHHWMDYWAPNWKDEQGQMREKTVMRAAEDLRKAGYNIWMSYYQDGENFEMKDFVRNVTEKRDVHQWLQDFAASPVWPKIQGKPMQLVYARNGAPKMTTDHAGFREYLKGRYGTIEALNDDWGSRFAGFDAVEMDITTRGPQRAWSAKYQHEIWRKAWSRLDQEVRQQFRYPGMVASFDVGYAPFRNLGYAEFIKSFGGPHSYAGIFAQPHDQDADRFIQANVSKAYGAVFLDHYKNFYHDWDIRVPGTGYLPDPHHFDRFWVGDLMRYATAILHLSWNEWWEGSNLEPCMEWGKTYCEKELFYSTVMQLCYPSLRDWSKGARVALLLNDYQNLAGSIHPEELRDTLQTLRRLNCDFDLLPDDRVTSEMLNSFRVVIAPSCEVGFGYNERNQRIAPLLMDWVRGGKDRRLIVSADPRICRSLSGEAASRPAASGPATSRPAGGDMNLLVDIGEEGDEQFLLTGCTQRESWGKVPAGWFALGPELKARWTPAIGRVTTLQLPLSPNRDHVLRLGGISLWPSTIEVRLDGIPAGRVSLKPGHNEYECAIPASVVGDRGVGTFDLIYDPLRVPRTMDAKAYPGEDRNCNLAIDWVQIATANVPARTTARQQVTAVQQVRFSGELSGGLKGRVVDVPLRSHAPSLGKGQIVSTYQDGAPRDAIIEHGQGQVWYVNGLFTDVRDDEYWRAILSKWASASPAELVRGTRSAGTRLSAGQTDLLLAYNYTINSPDRIRCRVPEHKWPLSEAVALTRDGAAYQPIKTRRNGSWIEWDDTLGYYGVYQLAFAPVRVETGSIALSLGQTLVVPAKVTNIRGGMMRVKLGFRSVIPTLTGKPVDVSLWPGQSVQVGLPITAAATADWGRKTAVIEIECDKQKAYLFREVVVMRPPSLHLARSVVSAVEPKIEVRNDRSPHGEAAPALEVTASVAGRTVEVGQIPAGGQVGCPLPALPAPAPATGPAVSAESAALSRHSLRLTCVDDRRRLPSKEDLWLARPASAARSYPNAVAAISAFNHYERSLDRRLVHVPSATPFMPADAYHVRNATGQSLPAQVVDGGGLVLPVTLHPHSAASYTLVRGKGNVGPTDLSLRDNRSGDGSVTVSNAFFEVTLSQARGGCVTRLISKRTQTDYADSSFDANAGRFSRYDPNSPATNTEQYICEDKTALSTRRCVWKRVDGGPLVATVQTEITEGDLRCLTTYEFRAGEPWFRLIRHLRFVGKDRPQEIVAVDARFRRGNLSKSFPTFVGEISASNQPHFGWRYGNWVPDYLTLMAPPKFDESLSLLVLRKEGLDQVRQGFWPAERPKSGPCAQARIELISRGAAECEVELIVYLHQGHQVIAAALLDEFRDPPLAILTPDPLWREN